MKRACCLLLLLAACGEPEVSVDPETTSEVEPPPAAGSAPRAVPEVEDPEPDVPQEPPKRLFARKFVVPVRAAPSREAERIGYLRAGAVLMATTAQPVVDSTERCRRGWYELTTGGFVCNGRDVIPFEGDTLPERRATQPDREAALPYEYGFIRRPVPMYRRLPSDEEAHEFEGYRIPGATPAPTDAPGIDPEATMEFLPSELAAMGIVLPRPGDEEVTSEMAAAMGMATVASEMVASEMGMAPETVPLNPTMAAIAAASANSRAAPGGDEEDDEDDENTGPTLGTLAAHNDSVVMRHLMRGFYVSLDRDFRRGARRYWRTQDNGFVPYTSVMHRDGSEFHGTPLNQAATGQEVAAGPTEAAEEAPAPELAEEDTAEATEALGPPTLPYAFVVARTAAAYTRGDNGRFRSARGPADYHVGFPILEEVEERGSTYVRGPENKWYRDRDLRIARAQEPHRDIGESDSWFDVNLANQTLVAYEGRVPVYVTLISSGLPNRTHQPDRDYETITGLFRVKSKHLTDTMDGDTAVDGPYSVDDVPYVMYFELAYAFHGAFWHNRFGRPKSHGCVNLAPRDARYLFGWADPPLPEGWHSAYPSEETPGTWIWVHEDTMGRR